MNMSFKQTARYSISEPWTPEVQDLYITKAYNYYVEVHGDPALTFNPPRNFNWGDLQYEDQPNPLAHVKNMKTLSWLYRVGHDDGSIKISFHEFESAILCGGSIKLYKNRRRNANDHYWRNSHRSDTYWYDSHGVYYREKVGYKKKTAHKKKELDEKAQTKKDWREHKRFNDDKRKDRYWFRGRKSFSKKVSNRWNRSHERRVIHNQEWDSFLTLKEIHDRYMWD
jgi:hypothetical protein